MDEDFVSGESSEESDDGDIDESGMNSLKQGKKGRKANGKFSTPRSNSNINKTPSKKQPNINTVQSTPTRRPRIKAQTARGNITTPCSKGKSSTPRGKGPTPRSKAKSNISGGSIEESLKNQKRSDPADAPEKNPFPSKVPTKEAAQQIPLSPQDYPPDQTPEQEGHPMVDSQETSSSPSQTHVPQAEEPQDNGICQISGPPVSSPLSTMSKTPSPFRQEVDEESTISNMD